MTLRTLHGLSALLIAAFACIHIANHLEVAPEKWSS